MLITRKDEKEFILLVLSDVSGYGGHVAIHFILSTLRVVGFSVKTNQIKSLGFR